MDLSDSENAQGDVGVEKGQGVFVAHPGGTGPSAKVEEGSGHLFTEVVFVLYFCSIAEGGGAVAC